MDDAQRKKLIDNLSVKVNFIRPFTSKSYWPSRRWFVGKVIEHFEAQEKAGLISESAIAQKTEEVISASKLIVTSKINDINIGLYAPIPGQNAELHPKRKIAIALVRRQRLSEILYGAIAIHPDFVNSSYSEFFDFIIRRRYRSVTQMQFCVNPNTQGYFRYPEYCSTAEGMQLNKKALDEGYWERVYEEGYSFFILKPKGIENPVEAIQVLFTRYPKEERCNGNLLDCEAAMSVVLMDSLLETRHAPNKFFRHLTSRSARYLLIAHHDRPDSNYISDKTTEAVLAQDAFPLDDLQVGDHIYIYNYPLYKVFVPTGSWTGEYSLIYSFGDRNLFSRNGFRLGGHGKSNITLPQFYDGFFAKIKTYLNCVARIVETHLNNFKHNTLPTPLEMPVKIGGRVVAEDCKIYIYSTNIKFKSFLNHIKGEVQNFYIVHKKSETEFYNEFYIVNSFQFHFKAKHKRRRENKIKSVLQALLLGVDKNGDGVPDSYELGNYIPIVRPELNLSGDYVHEPLEWGIQYQDNRYPTGYQYHMLFYEDEKRHIIRINDIKKRQVFSSAVLNQPLFWLPTSYCCEKLNNGEFEQSLRQEFEDRGLHLGPIVETKKDNKRENTWYISDGKKGFMAVKDYNREANGVALNIYYLLGAYGIRPVVDFSESYHDLLRDVEAI